MSLEKTTSTLSAGYTVIPVGRAKPTNETVEEDNGSVVIMDLNILRNNGVRSLKPLRKLYHGLRSESNTGHDEEKPDRETKKRFSIQEYAWFQRLIEFYSVPRFRKRINDALVIVIIGIIAGTLALLTEAGLNNRTSRDTYLMHRLDRLIRAVELDWGR